VRIYIWENDGISDAYHDDGTLVVLAESAEQAREVVRADKAAIEARSEARQRERETAIAKIMDTDYGGGVTISRPQAWEMWRATPEGQANIDGWVSGGWDGSDAALDREPDRVIELDRPTLVAFNGGGYD